MIELGEHITIFGMTGCGKTTLTRKLAQIFTRRVVFDRLLEWNESSIIIVHHFTEFARIYRELYSASSFTIVYRPSTGMPGDALCEETDKILSLIYQVESHNSQGIALIFEEVWLYAPVHSIPPWFQEICLTGRHYKISVLANSQRPAHVSKTLITQSRHVFIGQFFEMNDRKYLEATLGQLPGLKNPPQPGTFIWFQPKMGQNTQSVSVF